MASTIVPVVPPSKIKLDKKSILLISQRCVKAINIVFFIALTSLVFRELYHCVEKYVSFPKYTTLKFVSQREVDFPSLTFCSDIVTRFKPDALQVYFTRLIIFFNIYNLIIFIILSKQLIYCGQ